jgi:hypothetical protein
MNPLQWPLFESGTQSGTENSPSTERDYHHRETPEKSELDYDDNINNDAGKPDDEPMKLIKTEQQQSDHIKYNEKQSNDTNLENLLEKR